MANSSTQFTPGQLAFISEYARRTGLNPQVVAAEVFNEENGSAARNYQASNDNDWLNIGRTDSGNYGASNNAWSNPITAADLSAQWVQGKTSLPGFGHAAPGIVAFSKTAGQSPAAQIAALQKSGWASSGYPNLPQIYQQVSGTTLPPAGSYGTNVINNPASPGLGKGGATTPGTGATDQGQLSEIMQQAAYIAQVQQALASQMQQSTNEQNISNILGNSTNILQQSQANKSPVNLPVNLNFPQNTATTSPFHAAS